MTVANERASDQPAPDHANGTSNGEPTNGKARNLLKRPVLVLGWIPRIVVTIARSLHRHSIPVDVADFAQEPRPASRAVRQFRRVPHPEVDPAGFVEQLSDFIRQGGHDMVIPADDQSLVAVTAHYHHLQKLSCLACPPPEITDIVLSKFSTLELAQKCGLEIPNTKLISNSAQLPALFSSLPFPWVLKPSGKETRAEEIKSMMLLTADDVVARFLRAREFAPPMLLQEYCAGAGVGIEMLLHHGECLAAFQHRRIKEFPYTGGISVTAIAEAVNQKLLDSSLALLRALRWEGVAMVEYKVNPDGRAVFMEVNGRYWGTISLPIAAGIDFPLYQWQLLHGERPEIPKSYSIGTKWRFTMGYLTRLYSLLGQARHSAYARQLLRQNLGEMLGDFSLSVSDATFKLSDPMPSVVAFLTHMRYFASNTVKAVLPPRFFRQPQV